MLGGRGRVAVRGGGNGEARGMREGDTQFMSHHGEAHANTGAGKLCCAAAGHGRTKFEASWMGAVFHNCTN